MKRIASLVILLTISSKILGFFREIILSYFYGASSISDAFLISLTIPGTIFAFIGVGISTSFIPVYTKVKSTEDEETAKDFMNNIIGLISLLATGIVILTFFFTEELVKIFAIGFQGDTLSIAITFTRISILGVYFYGINYIFSSFLNTKNNFIAPILTTIPFNITSILAVILSSFFGEYLLAIGSLLAIIFQVIFLIPALRKKNYRFKIRFDLKNKHLKTMILMSLPVILGTSVNQINSLVDRTLASTLAVGGISALNYASRLNHFILGIFVTSIATVIFPSISAMSISNDYKSIKTSLAESVTIISLIIIPATIGSMLFSKQIVAFLFGRGAFDYEAINLTATALFYYTLGLVGFGMREVISKFFYALHDTKTPMINAVIGMVVNIILNIILSRYLGIGGLALATSIAATFTSALLFINLRKKIGPFGMKQISISFLKILFASSIMGGLAKLSFNYLTVSLSQNLSLLIAIGVGALSYFVIIYFMKIEDVDVIVGAIKKKLGRGAA
ncbi:murein biosynthesis integral membrane protein MurJ [Marinilactibacillus psychrotolerans]|uniref:murein biosynthesis integral membrane protein MurJ n=1 Tax=Marinilactibacillus psychrotolerans TaxID=191770 RepID=UPI003884070F